MSDGAFPESNHLRAPGRAQCAQGPASALANLTSIAAIMSTGIWLAVPAGNETSSSLGIEDNIVVALVCGGHQAVGASLTT